MRVVRGTFQQTNGEDQLPRGSINGGKVINFWTLYIQGNEIFTNQGTPNTMCRCYHPWVLIRCKLELKQISGSTGYPFLFCYPDIQNELTGYCEWLDDIHWRSYKVEIA